MTSNEFVEKVYALNLVAGVNEVHAVAKELFPDCEIMEMGFSGGYSPVINKGEVLLRDYLGKIDKRDEDNDIFENLDNTDYAFGTINMELNDKLYQIYHTGIGEWKVDILDNQDHDDVIELSSYENAIQYLFNLKNNQ
jgi:hypothetical protein